MFTICNKVIIRVQHRISSFVMGACCVGNVPLEFLTCTFCVIYLVCSNKSLVRKLHLNFPIFACTEPSGMQSGGADGNVMGIVYFTLCIGTVSGNLML